jgi:hypothetical protein
VIRPERALRFLDTLDCLGGALRLAWAGNGGRLVRAAALLAGFALGVTTALSPPL